MVESIARIQSALNSVVGKLTYFLCLLGSDVFSNVVPACT